MLKSLLTTLLAAVVVAFGCAVWLGLAHIVGVPMPTMLVVAIAVAYVAMVVVVFLILINN